MKKIIHYVLILLFVLFNSAFSESKYHHMPHGKFRNPEGSPIRDPNFKWSYKTFNEEKKKIKISIPSDHVVPKHQVLENINKLGVNFFDLSSSLESQLGYKDHLKIKSFMSKINEI